MPDWTTLITSVLASSVLSSVLTTIIAPSINWGIEKKKQTLADRKEKIQKWRQMVTEITIKAQEIQQGKLPAIPNVRSQAGSLIEHHQDCFYIIINLLLSLMIITLLTLET